MAHLTIDIDLDALTANAWEDSYLEEDEIDWENIWEDGVDLEPLWD